MLVSLIDPNFSSLDAPFDGGTKQRDTLRAGTSYLISRFIGAISLREPTADDPRWVKIEELARTEVTILKELTKYYVIGHPRVVSVRVGQRRMLRRLFGIYVEVIGSRKHRHRALLPQAIQDRRYSGDSSQRLASDLLASMTERQVTQTYQRLMGFVQGPVSYFDV
ncbi:MAG: hypothetical protein OXI84_01965 [bacterium]|nr:hypothetical protein [bacterium]